MGRIDRFVTSSRHLRGAAAGRFGAARLGAVLLCAGIGLAGVGCDDEAVGREVADADPFALGTGLDASVPGLVVLQFPEKTRLDVLLVIDDSPGMCEGQDALARNLAAHAADLARLAAGWADLRVAVTSTDLRHPERGGRFLTGPNPEGLPEACAVGAAAVSLDCPGGEGAIVNASDFVAECPLDDRACVAERLTRALLCRARVGVAGDQFGGGLEATRKALSCEGPNAALFGACCEGGTFNRDCDVLSGPRAPEFLRPDAVLGLVIVSNRDDCSAPADNPTASNRGVCRPDGLQDLDADGMPDVYLDRRVCPDSNAEILSCAAVCAAPGEACDQCRRAATEVNCFKRDCGGPPCAEGERPEDGYCTTATDCRTRRCAIDRDDPSNCGWFRSNLTPVADYYNFLVGLKVRPREQLWVATVVASRGTYIEPTSPEQLPCLDADGIYDPLKRCAVDEDCPGDGNACLAGEGGERRCSGVGADDICCPGGACVGVVEYGCEGEGGRAKPGLRYLELSELFDRGFAAGEGCPPGTEGTLFCVSICNQAWAEALNGIRDKVASFIRALCLDHPAVCRVDGARPCATEAERAARANYDFDFRWRCNDAAHSGGQCDLRRLEVFGNGEDCQVLDDEGCVGGQRLDCDFHGIFAATLRLTYTPAEGGQ